MDAAALYAGTRGRITELVRALPPQQLETKAPATPEWRVRDIVCHLSGNLADILAANLDGVATDRWTAAQVDARCDTPIEDVLAEWAENGPKVEAMLESFGSTGLQIVMDTVTHEHDIRGAVNQPGARDSDAADASVQWLVNSLNGRLVEGALPGLRLVAGDQQWVIGPGEPAATATVDSAFELLRALIGRRSVTQVANWKWEGDPSPYFGVMAPWGLRATDLIE